MGYPVITMRAQADSFHLTQNRFLLDTNNETDINGSSNINGSSDRYILFIYVLFNNFIKQRFSNIVADTQL